MDKSLRLENKAIDAAIQSNWKEAVELNEQIIKADKKNVDAYLRIGFALLQSGKIQIAKKYYKKALILQPGSYVITENLERIKILEAKKIKQIKNVNLNPYLFLDQPGRTKTVTLVNCGQKAVLAKLAIGQEIDLFVKKRKVEVRTLDKEYIGSLPDDISKRLKIFIKAGSEFKCFVKEASLKQTVVFLKEEKKGKRVAKYASFPVNIQSNLQNISVKDDYEGKDEDEELSNNDLEKLAESLGEEKVDLGYDPEDKDEERED